MREPCDQAARTRALSDLQTTFLVEAGAGTGKTRLLVERFVSCLLACGSVRRVVAITFTDKAAGELRLRVRARLRSLVERSEPRSERWCVLRVRRQSSVGHAHVPRLPSGFYSGYLISVIW